MKKQIQRILAKADLMITKRSHFDRIRQKARVLERYEYDLKLVRSLVPEYRSRVIDLLPESRSQLRQDLFVLAHLNFLEHGFFVEFGATDGVEKSNSFLLEKKFQWKGILAEPAMQWHKALERNRSCTIDKRCVWRSSGEQLLFNEAENGEFSTINSFSANDRHSRRREAGIRYKVESISLTDLLNSHQAPQLIDYLSIDTEGSEYEILKAFDFESFQFKVISVEHNYTSNREKIEKLLTSQGYLVMKQNLSRFEDWYVLAS